MANVDKWSGNNPWLGLASYSEDKTLYGRDKETAVLSDVIKNSIATIAFGKSGVGKSSLISAGISPVLSAELYIPVKIRLVHNSDVSYIEQIENAVREKIACTDNLPTTIEDLGLWDFFHRHSFTTKEGEECTPVVIIDQFEEIFTLTDKDHKHCIREFFQDLSSLLNNIKPDNVKEVERQHNVAQTPAPSAGTKKLTIKRVGVSALQYSDGIGFRFVICLREDKLYLLERNSGNIPALKTNRFNLQALSVESAMEVITRPRPGLFTESEALARIDELADMGDEGVRTVDPAILSLYMYKYYEKRGTASTSNIFADYYNEATKEISGKSIAYLEKNLLTNSGYRNQVPLVDAISSGVTQDEIDTLLKSVILRTEKRKGIDYIEFSHDRLCAEAMKSRNDRVNKEQAKKSRDRMLLSFVVFAVSVGLLSYVAWQRQVLNEERKELKVVKNAHDSITTLNTANEIQKDSLITLNNQNLAKTSEIERQRDTLKSRLALINEQKRRIEELQSGKAEERSIVNREAGKLSVELPYNALVNLVSLTISGNLNGSDIKYLRDNIGKLKHLDLHDATIVKGGNAYSYKYSTENNIIGEGMFSNLWHLETIIIPNNATSIGTDAFSGCSGLTSVNIPNSVTTIGKDAFYGCKSLTSVNIPNSVTTIGRFAFYGCSGLTSVNIPNSVTAIDHSAFSGCKSLTTVNIPNSVTTIGTYAFAGCEGLKSVNIPNSLTRISESAFYGCSGLTSVNIPNSVTTIGTSAFYGCKSLTSVNIPNSVTTIGTNAFSRCESLTSVNIPNSVTTIGTDAFSRCEGLTSVTIPNSVTTIDRSAFYGCKSLTSVNIPNSVTAIDRSAFYGCKSLTSVNIPNSVTAIGNSAFYDCSGLTSVNIPNSIKRIKESAFDRCENLVHIFSEVEDINKVQLTQSSLTKAYTQFVGVPSNCTWHVPAGKSQEYTARPWWVHTWNIVEDLYTKSKASASYKNGVLNVNGEKYNMLPVEGGTFRMGTSDEMIAAGFGCLFSEAGDTLYSPHDNEIPIHEVTLDGYRIGETEVTQALWTAIMGSNPSKNKGKNLPVENVTWSDCQYFIHKLNTLTGKHFRLPTEAEWEFAARGGNKSKNTTFSGSNNHDEVGWFEENSGKKTHPVKQKQPNELGIYDMCGNVVEYCQDKGRDYDDKPQKNPFGTSDNPQRILRGGYSYTPFKWAYVSSRNWCEPAESMFNGFRLVIKE